MRFASVVMWLAGCAGHRSRTRKADPSLVDGPNISIVNGNDAQECKWKHQVSLQDHIGHYCGGTIVSKDWVLSAGHCRVTTRDQVWAGAWKLSRSSGAQKVGISRVVNHPRYTNGPWDLTLIRVQQPLKFNNCVGSASLPSSDVSVGTECWITGWGGTVVDTDNNPKQKMPDILQEGKVKIMSNRECEDKYKTAPDGPYPIKSVEICAHGSRNGQIVDACQGDSGGPLVCGSSAKWTIYGATSWGVGCAWFPGVWARVYHEMKWVRDTMGSGGGPSPSPPSGGGPSPSPPSGGGPSPSPPSGGGDCGKLPKVQCKANASCRWKPNRNPPCFAER